MNKSELLETYTAEQLADMAVVAMESKEDSEKMIQLITNAGNDLGRQLEEKQNEINCLKSKTAKYQKAFEDAKKERDCRIAEYQKKIDELDGEVKLYKEAFEKAKRVREQENSELHKKIYHLEQRTIADFLPTEPIKVAYMLIDNATAVYENYVEEFAKAYSGQLVIGNPCEDVRRQTFSYLRQIAEHLLIYCNANGEGENEE